MSDEWVPWWDRVPPHPLLTPEHEHLAITVAARINARPREHPAATDAQLADLLRVYPVGLLREYLDLHDEYDRLRAACKDHPK